MRARIACAVILLAVALAAPPARAALSQPGPTGYVALPSAEVAPGDTWVVAADAFSSDFTDTTLPARFSYGVFAVAEVGGSYTYSDDGHTVGVHGKYLLPDRFERFDVALGAVFQRGNLETRDISFLQFFTACTARLPSPGLLGLSGTLGLNWTRFEFGDPFETGVRLFGGLEASFGTSWNAVAEIQTKDDAIDEDPLASVALRWTRGAWTVQGGLTNAWGLRGTGGQSLFAGVQYEFRPR